MMIEPQHLMAAPLGAEGHDTVKPASPADPTDPTYRKRVEDAAVKFEGLFIAQMLNEMKKATDQLKADNGAADRTSEAMLDYANRAVADAIAQQRGFGIADTLVAQMLPAEAQHTQQN